MAPIYFSHQNYHSGQNDHLTTEIKQRKRWDGIVEWVTGFTVSKSEKDAGCESSYLVRYPRFQGYFFHSP